MAPGAYEDKKRSVVLYPSMALGHLVSMVELGKLFVRRGLAVTIVVVESLSDQYHRTATYIDFVSNAYPSLAFHRLPPLPPSRGQDFLGFDLLRRSNSNLRSFLSCVSPAAIVIDFFCSYAFDVTVKLHIPCYVFYTSGLNILATFLYFPALHSATSKSFRELGKQMVNIPGIPPLPADHMPELLLDRDNDGYNGFLYHSTNFFKSDGILVNTFDALEQRALEAIAAGRCAPGGWPTPPIYCVGPLIATDCPSKGNKDECLAWLNAQPLASVVFLCFGSLGLLSDKQLEEIAVGLERSQLRFLWAVRSPPSSDRAKFFERQPEPDLEELLPSGFLDRTRKRGLVVKSWAPQVDVLNHESVGGFVTHCGWNSMMEAVAAGVPMVAWPLYAEQRMNKVYLVEELKLAVAMDGYDTELVMAEEVEAKVRWLMESAGGQELRERAASMKEKAAEALRDGGSSDAALMKLVSQWKRS